MAETILPSNNNFRTMDYTNFSQVENSSLDKLSDSFKTSQLVFAFVLSSVGFIGNSLTIYLIIKNALYKNICNIYILNLCVSNLITSAVSVPVLGVSFYYEKWIFGDVFCQIFPYIVHITTCSETNALLLITVNRYFLVVRPLLYSRLYKKTYFNVLLITSSWLVYILIQTLPLAKVWGNFEYNEHKHYCTYAENRETKIFIVLLCLFILLTNLPVHVFCYGSIFMKFRQTKRQMSVTQFNGGSTHGKRQCKDAMLRTTLLRTIIVIILCFVITHIPFLAVNSVDPTLSYTGITAYVVLAYIALSYIAINPVAYVLMNKQIFNRWKQLMVCFKTVK